jgi:peroxiredoxin
MSKTEPRQAPDLGFEVTIESGGRAYDAGPVVLPSTTLSPARAAAKERAKHRNLTIAGLCVAGLVAIVAWAWLSNPSANISSDALARVNGEFIYERDVNRELDLTRVSNELSNKPDADLPSPTSVLEDLIARKMQVQDARKAGVTMTAEEVDSSLADILDRSGISKEKLQAALAKYNLTLDDMGAVASDTYLINKYIAGYVLAGASTPEERQNKRNDWQTSLSQSAKVDRFKAAGSGPAPSVGSEAPDFTLRDLNGKDVSLSALRGQPVMINFWATWCPPCRAEIPTLVQMYKETHQPGSYEILGIATQSDMQTIQAFSKEFEMAFSVMPDNDSRITSLYHVLPIPTSFFVDKDGIIRYVQVGVADRPLLERWLLGK